VTVCGREVSHIGFKVRGSEGVTVYDVRGHTLVSGVCGGGLFLGGSFAIASFVFCLIFSKVSETTQTRLSTAGYFMWSS
jgi:hypothetical protein